MELVALRHWVILAVGSLIFAGLLALALVIGRAPGLSSLVSDPLFFRRCLVVHVNLSLTVWLHAFLAALLFLLPVRTRLAGSARFSVWIASSGVALLALAAGMRGARPVLSNYVPMIDHPLFAAGLVVFGLGVAASFLEPRFWPGDDTMAGTVAVPAAARPALRAAGLAFLLALFTLIASWSATPPDLPTEAYYENLVWGGGHVLQFASVGAMLAVWLMLLTPVLGNAPVPRRASVVLFAVFTLPLWGAPLLASLGTTSATYRVGFTRLMQFGIFPVVLVVLGACLRALRSQFRGRLREALSDARVTGFAVSAALTVVGCLLGAAVRGSNTMVPGHYHAAIGGVTASFMAMTYVLLAPIGLPLEGPRVQKAQRLQPVLFGAGQLVFAVGFALAGTHGMQRKVYANEQHIRTAAEYAGLGLMGLGGLVATLGGVLFLVLVGIAWWRSHARVATPPEAEMTWRTT